MQLRPRDTQWLARSRSENARCRAALTESLRALGLAVDTSFANFVLARFATPEAANAAEAHLRARGILVRKVAGYGFPEALRITVGTDADCARVTQALTESKGLHAW